MLAILVLIAGWFRSKGMAVGMTLLALLFEVSIMGGSPWSWERITLLYGADMLLILVTVFAVSSLGFYLLGSGMRWLWLRFRRA